MQEQRSSPRHFALIYSYRKMFKKSTLIQNALKVFFLKKKQKNANV